MRTIDKAIVLTRKRIEDIQKIIIEKVCIGLGYTCVKLNTGHVGFCYTQINEISPYCCQVNDKAGNLAGSKADELLSLAKSWDLIERIVGMATINALFQIMLDRNLCQHNILSKNIIDAIEIKKSDIVILVGNIKPLKDPINKKSDKLYIIERNPLLRNSGVFPETACEVLLPKANVVIVTGSAIANNSIDRILELSKNAKEIAIAGPSSGIIPDSLFDAGVTALGCVRVIDSEKAFQIISEGGGTKNLRPVIKYITIKPSFRIVQK